MRLVVCSQWSSLSVHTCAKVFVKSVDAVAVVTDDLELVDDVLGIFLFLHLLIDEPFEHALGGEVVFRQRQ